MDKQFFSEEVKAAERSLYRIARCYLNTDADAADAVQEALLRAWAKRDTLREPRFFRTWLNRIAINVCKDELKRRKRVDAIEQIPEVSRAEPLQNEIRDAMLVIDAKYRVPLVLFYLDGYSVKEIAMVLRITQGAAKSRLFRAKEKLRTELNHEKVFEDE